MKKIVFLIFSLLYFNLYAQNIEEVVKENVIKLESKLKSINQLVCQWISNKRNGNCTQTDSEGNELQLKYFNNKLIE